MMQKKFSRRIHPIGVAGCEVVMRVDGSIVGNCLNMVIWPPLGRAQTGGEARGRTRPAMAWESKEKNPSATMEMPCGMVKRERQNASQLIPPRTMLPGQLRRSEAQRQTPPSRWDSRPYLEPTVWCDWLPRCREIKPPVLPLPGVALVLSPSSSQLPRESSVSRDSISKTTLNSSLLLTKSNPQSW
jgi:hypothetical protein